MTAHESHSFQLDDELSVAPNLIAYGFVRLTASFTARKDIAVISILINGAVVTEFILREGTKGPYEEPPNPADRAVNLTGYLQNGVNEIQVVGETELWPFPRPHGTVVTQAWITFTYSGNVIHDKHHVPTAIGPNKIAEKFNLTHQL